MEDSKFIKNCWAINQSRALPSRWYFSGAPNF